MKSKNMAKTVKTIDNVVIDPKVVAQTVKVYKADIKSRRTALDKQYRILDKEGDALYELEQQVQDLQQILRITTAFNKVKK